MNAVKFFTIAHNTEENLFSRIISFIKDQMKKMFNITEPRKTSSLNHKRYVFKLSEILYILQENTLHYPYIYTDIILSV